jgi:hypothetical protein
MALELDRRPPFTAVESVLTEHDPENLLRAGAPADEYAPEADDFARRLREGQRITGDVVVEVWERWFGPASCYAGATAKDPRALAMAMDECR